MEKIGREIPGKPGGRFAGSSPYNALKFQGRFYGGGYRGCDQSGMSGQKGNEGAVEEKRKTASAENSDREG